MRGVAMLLLAAALPACATVDGPREPDRVTSTNPPCTADNTADFIGKRATAAIGEAIVARTGATIFQWVPPRTAVTMDYREDRVRVGYDDDLAIIRIACG